MKAEVSNLGGTSAGAISSAVRERILEALQGIRFGAVEIVIHDGKVVQIERKERVRFEK
jgi:hypothetical protein